MNLYFACQPAHRDYLATEQVPNILISYVHGYKGIRKVVDDINPKNLIIDSGAFSAWTVGEYIDIDNYAKVCLELMKTYPGKEMHFVNLDMIPGSPGRKPTATEIEYSAQKSWDNMLYLEDKGIPVMNVYHQHEELKWLERLMEHQEYFGVSPANDLTPKKRMVWLDQAFSIIRDTRKTHGFGATARSLLERYPWFSADSTSWMAPVRYGKSATGNFKSRGLDQLPNLFMKAELPKEIKRWIKVEKEVSELWEQRGVKWL